MRMSLGRRVGRSVAGSLLAAGMVLGMAAPAMAEQSDRGQLTCSAPRTVTVVAHTKGETTVSINGVKRASYWAYAYETRWVYSSSSSGVWIVNAELVNKSMTYAYCVV